MLLAGIGVALALVAVTVTTLRRSPPPLLSIATRVTPPSFVADDVTVWQCCPDGTVLLAHLDRRTAPRMLRWSPRERRMRTVGIADNAIPTRFIDAWSISPDGRWLATTSAWMETTITDLATGASRSYNTATNTMAVLPGEFGWAWSPDGRRCAGYEDGTGLLPIIDVASGRLVRHASPADLHTVIGWSSAGQLVLSDLAQHGQDLRGVFHIAKLGLTTGRVADYRAIPLPPDSLVLLPYGWRFFGVSVSPRDDRVACLVTVQRQSTSPPWMRRLLQWLGQKPPGPAAELWTFRLDGSEMREVGTVPVPEAVIAGGGQIANATPVGLRWTPDGKRIGFIYKGAIYTVPADR